MVEEHQRLDDNLYQFVSDEGYSRYPVYSGSRNNITGILFTKDLLTEEDGITIKDTEEAFESDFMKVRGHELLDAVLAKMLKRRDHIAIVYNRNDQVLGVISLEDIIEEIIQFEIEDENDDVI